MSFLYVDLETIPAQSPAIREAIAKNVRPPAAMKKAETIAAWEASDKAKAVDEAVAKTSFDGAYGHICCIGFAYGDMQPDCTYLKAYSPAYEATVIRDFIAAVDDLHKHNPYPLCIVGHNVINFDIRFLWQRAIVLGIKMPGWMPRDPKPWSGEAFDTMTAFAGQRGTIGMDRLCEALGMEGKGEIDGSMVADLWAKGEHQKIAEYCMADVERTRAIHRRMQVAFGEMAA